MDKELGNSELEKLKKEIEKLKNVNKALNKVIEYFKTKSEKLGETECSAECKKLKDKIKQTFEIFKEYL